MERSEMLEAALANERRIGVPARWGLVLLGLVMAALGPSQPFAGGLPPEFLAFAAFAVGITWALVLRDGEIHAVVPLLWAAYLVDVLYASSLIGRYGGLASPLYLLYGPLALRAALYSPGLRGVLWAPFGFGPLYVLTLILSAGEIAFLGDPLFLQRYVLLSLWVGVAVWAAWVLVTRGERIGQLRRELARQAQDLEQKAQTLQRTAADLGDRVLELRSLQDLALALSSTLRLEEILRLVAERLATVPAAQGGAVALWDPERRELSGVRSDGEAFRIGVDEDPRLAEVFANGRSPSAAEHMALERVAARWWPGCACLIVPLVARDRAIGALFLASSPEMGTLDEKTRQLAIGFAYLAATAIENARLYQDVWEKSRELEAVLQGIGDGVVVTDRSGALVLLNPVAATIFGLDQMPPAGVPLTWAIKHEPFLSLVEETLAEGHDEIRDLDLPGADGRVRTYQALASPVRDATGVPGGVVTVLRDVTAQKELERMKSNFLSVVSHELRTPLHSIKGFVEIILMGKTGPINELQQDFLGTVKEQTVVLQRQIDDLLEFSRLESGQIRLHVEPVPLGVIARVVQEKLSPLAGSAGLTLVNRVPVDLPEVDGDRMRLEQVLTNLVENAIKFTPAGGRITIAGRDLGDAVEISVQDTGIGIPPSEQERVFDRFYQVDGGVNRMYRGTGLGLTICKHIVERHHGQIWVESNPQVKPGSTFYVRLPKQWAGEEAALDFSSLPRHDGAEGARER
ncbi:MAG: PAS domain-containing protein [Chloroflexi bacterium]|nr:PAS domain-containing protein [Chloroflexota bacterium]